MAAAVALGEEALLTSNPFWERRIFRRPLTDQREEKGASRWMTKSNHRCHYCGNACHAAPIPRPQSYENGVFTVTGDEYCMPSCVKSEIVREGGSSRGQDLEWFTMMMEDVYDYHGDIGDIDKRLFDIYYGGTLSHAEYVKQHSLATAGKTMWCIRTAPFVDMPVVLEAPFRDQDVTNIHVSGPVEDSPLPGKASKVGKAAKAGKTGKAAKTEGKRTTKAEEPRKTKRGESKNIKAEEGHESGKEEEEEEKEKEGEDDDDDDDCHHHHTKKPKNRVVVVEKKQTTAPSLPSVPSRGRGRPKSVPSLSSVQTKLSATMPAPSPAKKKKAMAAAPLFAESELITESNKRMKGLLDLVGAAAP